MEPVHVLIQIVLVQCVFEVVSTYKILTKEWLPGSFSIFGAQLQEKATRNMFQCENLCKAISPCVAVSYSTRTRKCSLFKEVPAKDNMRPSIHDIRISDIREFTKELHSNRCQNGSAHVKNGIDRICLLAGVSCGLHPILPHADVTSIAVTYNSSATYTCHTGYRSEGSSLTSRCTEDGSWSPLGSCTQISCGEPREVVNARVDYTATSYGSTATYTCDEGYVFDGGDPKTICSVSGVWSTLNGSCKQISCGEPREVVNARVDYTATSYGSTATYTCDEGYVFDGGDPETICTISGDWSALSGSCERTLEYLGCYVDDGDRMLDGNFMYSHEMTKDKCFGICRDGGNQYAGLEAAYFCQCGNTQDPEYDQIDESQCSFPCAGNQTQMCGGHWRMSLYKIFYVI